jgi:hypothetical protein
VNIVLYFSDYFCLFVRTTLVVPWLSDDLLFQRGCRRKPLFVLLIMRMMLVKWKGKFLKSVWYSKVGFFLQRFSVRVRLVVAEKSVGIQSHIYVYRGCNEMRACFSVGAIWCMCAVAVAGSPPELRNKHTQSVDAGSEKRSFHVSYL